MLAGKCTEQAEREYFDEAIAPRLGPGVEWTGEADAHRKKVLLSRARCLLFPLQWPEPFGIVMAEAMACGTPVVALDEGSVPEVVEHGVTGFVLRQSGGHGPRARSPPRHPARGMPGARRGMLSSEAMVSSYESVFVDVARG